MSDPDFPCSLTISVPLPSARLASSALRALEVDEELSPLVRRTFSLRTPSDTSSFTTDGDGGGDGGEVVGEKVVLVTAYKATTNRMLRVAVNGFLESLGVVLGVMQELDVDVLKARSD